MSDPITLDCTADGEGFVIRCIGRVASDGDSAWERDAIAAEVCVSAGPFAGRFATVVWSHELGSLYRSLHALWRGFGQAAPVAFALVEGTLTLTVALARSGHVELAFDARPDTTGATVLHGELTAEHAALAGWLQALFHVLQTFPSRLSSERLPAPPRTDG